MIIMSHKNKVLYINPEFDYDYIGKVTRKSKHNDSLYDFNPILTSIDSVFSKFEQIVLSSEPYIDLNPDSIKIKDYLVNTYKKSLQSAVYTDNNDKVVDICHKISRIFVADELSYIGRKKQEFEFFYDLTFLISKYKRCMPDLE